MTKQEFLRGIRGIIYIWNNEDTRQGGREVSELAIRIHAYYEEALPELAKEAGYVKLPEPILPSPICSKKANGK